MFKKILSNISQVSKYFHSQFIVISYKKVVQGFTTDLVLVILVNIYFLQTIHFNYHFVVLLSK